jgi:hypothetical protein
VVADKTVVNIMNEWQWGRPSLRHGYHRKGRAAPGRAGAAHRRRARGADLQRCSLLLALALRSGEHRRRAHRLLLCR